MKGDWSKTRSVNRFYQKVVLVLTISVMGVFLPGLANSQWKPDEGSELIGSRAPELHNLRWLNCKPLTLASLRGKVVLIRFWLIDCSFCQRTAPALNYLLDKYQNNGLVIIGIHHPKSKEAENQDLVSKGAKELKFKFPVAMDNDWTNVNAFWLSKKKRAYTSASFLIDKRGKIRWIHPGGDIIKDENSSGSGSETAFTSLENEIKTLLVEK